MQRSLYRDASNYKTYGEVIVLGEIEEQQLHSYLWEGDFFVPSEVGLLDLQEGAFTEDDHIWHEIEFLQSTDTSPTTKISAKQLLEGFKDLHKKGWNQFSVFEKKGLVKSPAGLMRSSSSERDAI